MIIRINSHRARHRMESAIGRLPQGYFSLSREGEWRMITDSEWEKVKGIKGLTQSKLPDDAREYWNIT